MTTTPELTWGPPKPLYTPPKPGATCRTCEGWRKVVRFRSDGWEETYDCPDCATPPAIL